MWALSLAAANERYWQTVPNPLFYEDCQYIVYLTFSNFVQLPPLSPLFLLPCFFGWMCDHATSTVLFCLMILWTFTCQVLVP